MRLSDDEFWKKFDAYAAGLEVSPDPRRFRVPAGWAAKWSLDSYRYLRGGIVGGNSFGVLTRRYESGPFFEDPDDNATVAMAARGFQQSPSFNELYDSLMLAGNAYFNNGPGNPPIPGPGYARGYSPPTNREEPNLLNPLGLSARMMEFYDEARDSAREMAIERDLRRKDEGKEPLGVSNKNANYWQDVFLSVSQFYVDSLQDAAGLPREWFYPRADVQPYDYEDRTQAAFTRDQRIFGERKKIAEALLQPGSTGNPIVDQSRQQVADTLKTNVAINPLYAATGTNVSDYTYSDGRALQVALREADKLRNPVVNQARAMDLTFGNAADQWKRDIGTVQMLPADNPRLPAAAFKPGAILPDNLPVVIRYTPKTIPKPKMGWLGGIGGAILGAVLNLVPGVGTVASQAVAAGRRSSQKTFRDAFQRSPTRYSPSYTPQIIRLNMRWQDAKTVLAEPWRFPFYSELAHGMKQFAGAPLFR